MKHSIRNELRKARDRAMQADIHKRQKPVKKVWQTHDQGDYSNNRQRERSRTPIVPPFIR